MRKKSNDNESFSHDLFRNNISFIFIAVVLFQKDPCSFPVNTATTTDPLPSFSQSPHLMHAAYVRYPDAAGLPGLTNGWTLTSSLDTPYQQCLNQLCQVRYSHKELRCSMVQTTVEYHRWYYHSIVGIMVSIIGVPHGTHGGTPVRYIEMVRQTSVSNTLIIVFNNLTHLSPCHWKFHSLWPGWQLFWVKSCTIILYTLFVLSTSVYNILETS